MYKHPVIIYHMYPEFLSLSLSFFFPDSLLVHGKGRKEPVILIFY